MTNKQFLLPSKPSIELKEQGEDKRAFSIIPIRAINDKRLTRGDLVMLMTVCSYCSRGGYTTVSNFTMAKYRGVSAPYISKQLNRLVKFGYVEQVRGGYTGLRGALKRVIFDASLRLKDVISISNAPVSEEIMKHNKIKPLKRSNNNKRVSDTNLTFDDAVLVVSHSLKSEADLLKLTKLVEAGISHADLIKAFGKGV